MLAYGLLLSRWNLKWRRVFPAFYAMQRRLEGLRMAVAGPSCLSTSLALAAHVALLEPHSTLADQNLSAVKIRASD